MSITKVHDDGNTIVGLLKCDFDFSNTTNCARVKPEAEFGIIKVMRAHSISLVRLKQIMNFDLEQTIAILARSPDILRALVSDMSEEWTQKNYGANTWSAHEVLGHLIWGERTDWMPRLQQILAVGDAIPFEPFDRDGHTSLCEGSSTIEQLEIFANERSKNLEQLSDLSLSSNDLQKTGRHPALGVVTISELLAAWAVHDLNHVAQICKAMAYQFRETVGPWEAYLSILSPPNPR